MSIIDINAKIKSPHSRVFRKFWIKRRLSTTGLFESSWQELTSDVKGWGTISKSIDYVRYSRVRFSDASILVANDYGRYNPEDDEASFWYGYASQQRTLVKIEAGFTHQTLGADGIWTNTNLPSDPTIFIGVIQGDISLSDSNDVVLPVKPLMQVFRDFSNRNLTGLTTTGMTAGQFIQALRDQTDGSGGFIFRPFFADTTSNWVYTTSSIVYLDVSPNEFSNQPVATTTTQQPQNDFLQMNVWDAIERLAEAENKIPYISRDGKFKFIDRSANSAFDSFAFYGLGFNDGRYGVTIKKLNGYKTKISDFYSRVEVKWNDMATSTAIVATQTSLAVGNNNFFNYGQRTYSVDNPWLATITSARTVAGAIFDAVSSVPKEIDFTTSFVPHLEVLDLVTVSYESGNADPTTRWDLNDWAEDDTQSSTDLIWAQGDALSFVGDEFKLTSIDIDLDGLECHFIGIKTGGQNANAGGATVGSAIIGDAILS
jgi:hypothetical protein